MFEVFYITKKKNQAVHALWLEYRVAEIVLVSYSAMFCFLYLKYIYNICILISVTYCLSQSDERGIRFKTDLWGNLKQEMKFPSNNSNRLIGTCSVNSKWNPQQMLSKSRVKFLRSEGHGQSKERMGGCELFPDMQRCFLTPSQLSDEKNWWFHTELCRTLQRGDVSRVWCFWSSHVIQPSLQRGHRGLLVFLAWTYCLMFHWYMNATIHHGPIHYSSCVCHMYYMATFHPCQSPFLGVFRFLHLTLKLLHATWESERRSFHRPRSNRRAIPKCFFLL